MATPPGSVLPSNLASDETHNVVQHKHRRFFIGPMPEKVISQKKALSRKAGKQHGFLHAFQSSSSVNEDQDQDLSRLLKAHAFDFFIHGGGKAENWGEEEERNTTEIMVKRWKQSEWGKIIHSGRHETRQVSHWVGEGFEIGSFLGMNIIHNEAAESVRDGISSRSSRKAKSSTETNEVQFLPVTETISSGPSRPAQIPDSEVNDQSAAENIDNEYPVPISASSSTALLKPPAHASLPKPILRTRSSPAAPLTGTPGIDYSQPSSLQKAKSVPKFVHYSEMANGSILRNAPPDEVLERSGSAIEGTSAGATLPEESQEDLRWGDVVMRDRMLVGVLYTRSEIIGSSFDENQNRTMVKLHYEDWAEHLVVWRKDLLEIYQNYSMPWKEWINGHKELVFVVPLKTSRTYLSMYSFVDLTFCIACPPMTVDTSEKKRLVVDNWAEGTSIFIFKVKNRSRALDWVWKLWRYLGGQIPSSLDIQSPSLDVRVKVELPQSFLTETHETFTRQNIIRLCTDALSSVPDWDYIIKRRMVDGNTLELAWRMDTKLDWIWQDDCIDGTARYWAVLCGLALRQGSSLPYLEIRLGEHFPGSVHAKDGTQLHEPPSIEGYLDRIKPNSQTRQPVYLATHDGNLFYLTPTSAYPPTPPGLHTARDDTTDGSPTMHQTEVKRGSMQILNAIGVNDLRDILVVRRAFQNIPQPLHNEPIPKNEDALAQMWTQSQEESHESDNEDPGGDEGIARTNNRDNLRMKRSFELLFKNGHIIRFEAYSRRVALEWIDRLRALIVYWRQRHHVDAREEMDLVQGLRPRLTPLTFVCHRKHSPPDEPPDLSASMPALSSIYHWCVMKGCKSIVKGGKLHTRRGLYGPYKMVHLFLVSGQLVQYHISPKYSLHFRQSKIINLLDAYVCSGYFAARVLPKGQYNPNAPPTPRRYQDGLETEDPEEDTLFTVFYRKKAPVIDTSLSSDDVAASQSKVHGLASRRKLVIFKTRSKLERDAWCWAMNCEIEKMVRLTTDREDRLRAQGKLAEL